MRKILFLLFTVLLIDVNGQVKNSTQANSINVGVNFVLKGAADVPGTKVIVSKFTYRKLVPLAIDSFYIQKDGTFYKQVRVESGITLALYIEGQNAGLIFPNSTRYGVDTLSLDLNTKEKNFKVKDKNKVCYAFFHDNYDRLKATPDSIYFAKIKENPEIYADWLEYDLANRSSIIDSFARSCHECLAVAHYFRRMNVLDQTTRYYKYLSYHNFYVQGKLSYLRPDSSLLRFAKKIPIDTNDIWLPDFNYALNARIEALTYSLLLEGNLNKNQPFILNKFSTAASCFPKNQRSFAEMLVIDEFIRTARTKSDFNRADSLRLEVKKHDSASLYYKYIEKLVLTKNPFNSEISLSLPDTTGAAWTISDSNFPIKVLFFWGTWCEPCKDQIPGLVDIMLHFAGNKGIQFINVALESKNVAGWKKAIHKYKLIGVNLYCEGDVGNEQMKKLNITAVPKIIIVKNGKIIDYRANKPSNGLLAQLEKLLFN